MTSVAIDPGRNQGCPCTPSQMVGGFGIASVVSAVAVAAFKTAPLWVPALVAAGPIGWGVLSGIAILAALAVLGVYAAKATGLDEQNPTIVSDEQNEAIMGFNAEARELILNIIKDDKGEGGMSPAQVDEFIAYCGKNKVLLNRYAENGEIGNATNLLWGWFFGKEKQNPETLQQP